MTTIAQQVSRAIRILRGNRDESARASHLVVEKDLLMTYETDLIDQAEREKCSQSTFFERKIMKTAFKRVALVAAAALAIGGVSAVSANATAYSEALSISAASSTVSSGATASIVATDTFLPSAANDTTSYTAFLISSPAGNAVLPTVSLAVGQAAANTAANSTVTGAGTQTETATATAGGVATTAVSTVSLVNVAVAGTYVVKLIPANSNT